MKGEFLRCVILGAPASGKGTISSRIVKYFDMKHLASGDLLRNHMHNKTDLGTKAKAYVDSGKLVPDKIMVDLVADELSHLSKHNWLLDGFPRTKNQAVELFSRYPVDVAINLVVPFDVIVQRVAGRWIHLKSGRVYNIDFNAPKIPGKDDVTGEDLVQRPDDAPEAVKKRLKIYTSTTEPVMAFYQDKSILQEFCGRTSNEIWPHVYKYLASYIEPKLNL